MDPLVTVSGGQAWGEKVTSSSALTSLTPRSLSNHFSLLLVLLAVTLLSLSLYLSGYNSIPGRSMANGPTANGKHHNATDDFRGDIKVNNNPPTKEQLEKIADLPVLDVNKKKCTFKSLYADNENGPRRVFVVFIRHFFCGVRLPSHSGFRSYLSLTYSRTCRTAKNIFVSLPPPLPHPTSLPYHHLPQLWLSAAANQTSSPCTFGKPTAHFPYTPTQLANSTTCSV